jgi:hypothetical protein
MGTELFLGLERKGERKEKERKRTVKRKGTKKNRTQRRKKQKYTFFGGEGREGMLTQTTTLTSAWQPTSRP